MLDTDGTITRWNSGAETLLGYREEEIIGKPLSTIFTPEERANGVPARELEKAKFEGSANDERWLVRSDGSMFWGAGTLTPLWDESHILKGFAKLIHDDTAKKQNEMERARILLVERKAKEDTQETLTLLNAIFETAPVGLAFFDRDCRYVRVNRYLADVSGVSVEDHIGRSVERLRPDVWTKLKPTLKSVLELGAPQLNIETTVKTPSSPEEEHHWIMSFYPLRTEEGKIIGATKVVVDITDRIRAEKELMALAEKLKTSNEDLQRFAYAVSHDLQEPLRTIASHLTLFTRRYGTQLGSDATDYLGFAIDGAGRMRTLIEDLLKYAQVETKPLIGKTIDAEQVLQAAMGNLAAAIQESQAKITYDPLPEVYGDHTQLVQLFQNLIANAIKYRREEEPTVHISSKDADTEWLLCVKDNGLGFEMQYATRIFNAFERLHGRKEYPGSGIGLATCKKIIDRHGGRIWAEAVPGKGASFYFTLPKALDRG